LTLKSVRARMTPRDLAAYAANIGETNDVYIAICLRARRR